MISLDYKILRDRDYSSVNWRDVDEMQLRYDCFFGDIYFVAAGLDLSADWGWIPVLDFALAMKLIGTELVAGRGAVFDFTDSSLTIKFTPYVDKVSIQAEYVSGVATVRIADFEKAASAMLSHVRSDIESAHPDLLLNEEYLKAVGGRT